MEFTGISYFLFYKIKGDDTMKKILCFIVTLIMLGCTSSKNINLNEVSYMTALLPMNGIIMEKYIYNEEVFKTLETKINEAKLEKVPEEEQVKGWKYYIYCYDKNDGEITHFSILSGVITIGHVQYYVEEDTTGKLMEYLDEVIKEAK